MFHESHPHLFTLRWGHNMWQLLYCGDTVADMAKKNVRIDELIKFIRSEGGTTTKTNAEIAAALSSVENRHSGAIRVSEVLSELEDSGVVEVTRSRRHPVKNPSGRSITLVE